MAVHFSVGSDAFIYNPKVLEEMISLSQSMNELRSEVRHRHLLTPSKARFIACSVCETPL